MDKDMKELLMKKAKEGKKSPKKHMEAKMSVLEELREMMGGKMAEDLKEIDPKEMKKVTVASDSKEGLQAGLEKAEEMLENAPDKDEHKKLAEKHDGEYAKDHDGKDMEKYDEEYGKDSELEEEDMSQEEVDAMLEYMKKHKDSSK